jgi:hypothetical protein
MTPGQSLFFARCLFSRCRSEATVEAQSGVDSLEAVASGIDLVDERYLEVVQA